jgi:hypothetical protein
VGTWYSNIWWLSGQPCTKTTGLPSPQSCTKTSTSRPTLILGKKNPQLQVGKTALKWICGNKKKEQQTQNTMLKETHHMTLNFQDCRHGSKYSPNLKKQKHTSI